MSLIKIQETANGGAQLSQGRYFLIANKWKINKGANVGKALIAVRLSELVSNRDNPETVTFNEVKSWLLTPKEFETWIALLIQVSEKKLTDIKDGEPIEGQKKL